MTELERILRNQREELESTDFSEYVTRKEEEFIDLACGVAVSPLCVKKCSNKAALCLPMLISMMPYLLH